MVLEGAHDVRVPSKSERRTEYTVVKPQPATTVSQPSQNYREEALPICEYFLVYTELRLFGVYNFVYKLAAATEPCNILRDMHWCVFQIIVSLQRQR